MSRRTERIVPLSEMLDVFASRLKKVDLRIIDDIQALWPTIVEPIVAQRCQPEMIKDGVLILSGFSVLGEKAPRSLKTRISEA